MTEETFQNRNARKRGNINRLAKVSIKYFKISWRDRQNLFWMFLYPILLMVLFFIAFGGTNTHSTFSVAIINNDTNNVADPTNSWAANASLTFVDQFNTTTHPNSTLGQTFHIITKTNDGTIIDENTARTMVSNETLDAVIVIPENFSETIIGHTWWYPIAKSNPGAFPMGASLQDTSFPLNATPQVAIFSSPDEVTKDVVESMVQGVINQLIMNYNNVTALNATITIQDITRNITTFDYMAPAFVIVGMLVSISNLAVLFASDRKLGLMKRLDTTPVPRGIQLLGGGVAQVGFSAIQAIILLSLTVVFGVSLAPNINWLLAFLNCILAALPCIGLALILASLVNSPSAAGGGAWAFILPLQFLGGAFFPIDPSISQYVPSYYAVHAAREIMILGAGLTGVAFDFLMSLVFGLLFIVIGVILFQKRKEI